VQVPSRIPDQPCADCLDQSPAAERRRPGVPGRVAFWLLAFVFAATMLGTTLPTPLYDIYQAQWHFSAAIVTVTFAVYAAGILLTLLLTGRTSDQAGRKPVLAAALGCSALSTVVFILAPNVGVTDGNALLLAVRDDGAGGADFTGGTGLAGLKDRVEALGGRIFLDSPPGAGTSLRVELPLTASTATSLPLGRDSLVTIFPLAVRAELSGTPIGWWGSRFTS